MKGDGLKAVGNQILKSIKSGKFAKRLNSYSESDKNKTDKKISRLIDPEFEKAAQKYSK